MRTADLVLVHMEPAQKESSCTEEQEKQVNFAEGKTT